MRVISLIVCACSFLFVNKQYLVVPKCPEFRTFGTGAEVSVRHFGTSAEMSRHFGTITVVPKCLRSEVSWVRSVLTPLALGHFRVTVMVSVSVMVSNSNYHLALLPTFYETDANTVRQTQCVRSKPHLSLTTSV